MSDRRIGKHRERKRIDTVPDAPFSVSSGVGTGFVSPPAPPTIPAPTGLVLTSTAVFSAVTPTARIDATWNGLETYDLETYAVQISTDSTFATDTEIYTTAPNQDSISIFNRRVSTTYYAQVRTVVGDTPSAWSASASVTTLPDTTAPAVPTSPAAAFIGAGDLVITWTNPTSANFRDVEIGIYSDSSKITNYALIYDATGRYVWAAAQNLAATSNLGDPSLYVELRSRSWGTVFSAAVNTGTVTKARPATPAGLTTSWTGDTGNAGADCLVSWATATDAALWVVTVDGVSRTVYAPFLAYALDMNRADHSGAPDPLLSITVAAYDALKQSNSASATATATNAAPAAPAVALSGGGMSLLVCRVTSASAADFAVYEYVWRRDGTTVRTLESSASEQQYEAVNVGDEGIHSWTCTVRQKDVFGQYSTATASSAVVVDALTIGSLRSLAIYTDDVGNSASTLSVLKDGLIGAGVTYSA